MCAHTHDTYLFLYKFVFVCVYMHSGPSRRDGLRFELQLSILSGVAIHTLTHTHHTQAVCPAGVDRGVEEMKEGRIKRRK